MLKAPIEHFTDMNEPVEYTHFIIDGPLYYADLIFGRFCNEQILPAVSDASWQEYRTSMKGETTEKKLTMLREWRDKHTSTKKMWRPDGEDYPTIACFIPFRIAVQITNYINALKRGGLLK